jgi:DNA-binding transcriptional LysR family regulator
VNSAELVPQLEHAKLDLGLVIDDGLGDSRFRVETLRAEPLSLLASSRHPLFALGTIGAEDLRDQPFLLTDPGCAYRTKLERALATANVRLKAVMEFTSVETIKQCAGLGMGIACLPTIVAETEIAAHKLVALRWSGSDLTLATHKPPVKPGAPQLPSGFRPSWSRVVV